jgi:putative hemolysin
MANGGIVALALWPVWLGEWPLWSTLLAVLGIILILGEIFPKTLAVRAPERWALRIAPLMSLLRAGTTWFQNWVSKFNDWLLNVVLPKTFTPRTGLSDEEYQELLEMAYQQGTLAQSERDIILQIISLDRKTAKDVMRPRSRMAEVSDELNDEQMRAAARQCKHRRLPIYDAEVEPGEEQYEKKAEPIVMVLNARKLLLEPGQSWVEATEPPSFVPETMNLLQLLKSLQRQQRGLAIVVDEFGYASGLVTVEDILEEVVGEIHSDEQTPGSGFIMEKLGEGKWRVNGTMWLEDFRREYPNLGDINSVDTMGGLVVHLLQVVPNAGQSVAYRGLRLTAKEVDERRVREVLVEVVKKK